ncbi:MAG: hypothetical protein J2P53_10130 [Bradyrhizobiaceae bacterium]|nr:hypothetical protein [Bradyrhizobiaceae bacterium]
MSILVPIILAVALAVSFYGQAPRNWQSDNVAQGDKSDKSSDDSSKDKSDGAKPEGNGKVGKTRASAPPKARQDGGTGRPQ